MAKLNPNVARRRGLALIEAALVIPLLLLMTFGLIEYGWMFLRAEQVSNTAREGVRVAIRPDATTAQVQSSVSTLMSQHGLGSSGYTVTITPSDVTKAATGATVQVRVALTYSNVALTHLPFVPVPTTLQSQVSMAKEGP